MTQNDYVHQSPHNPDRVLETPSGQFGRKNFRKLNIGYRPPHPFHGHIKGKAGAHGFDVEKISQDFSAEKIQGQPSLCPLLDMIRCLQDFLQGLLVELLGFEPSSSASLFPTQAFLWWPGRRKDPRACSDAENPDHAGPPGPG